MHILNRLSFISFLIEFLFNFIFSKPDLNLSNNQLNKLPDEFADLTHLLRLDISHNLFLSLPKVVFKMPKLRQLKANNNAIIGKNHSISSQVNINLSYRSFLFNFAFVCISDIETEEIITTDSMELVDLRKNPLTPQCLDRLRNARVTFHIMLPERVLEDWEDLSV